jgi:hypothetical protein
MEKHAASAMPGIVARSAILCYSPADDEYGIMVHDGGDSYVTIQFCPWCGARLPASKFAQRLEALESLGFDEWDSPDIPDDYKTDGWWSR